MTQPLDQSQLVPGRADKTTDRAYRTMMEAFRQGHLPHPTELAEFQAKPMSEEMRQGLQQIADAISVAAIDSQAFLQERPRPQGTTRERVTAARAARGNTGIPRSWIIGGGAAAFLVLTICVWAVFFRGGGSTPAADPDPAAAVATAQPTKQASTMGQVGPDGKPVVDTMMTGAVFVSGDLKLMLSTDTGSIELNATASDGEFRNAGEVIGTISSVDGGKLLKFNGQVAVSVKLIKVDASLPPVTMYMGARKFTALALLDGQYQLVTFDEAGQAQPPMTVDPKTDAEGGVGMKNSPIVRVSDAGDGLLFTFPKAQPMPTPDPNAPTATPAAQG